MLDNVEVAQRTLALDQQPAVDAGAVEGVGAGQPPRLVAFEETLQAHRALTALVGQNGQRNAAEGLLRLTTQAAL